MNKLLIVIINLSPVGGTIRRLKIWLDNWCLQFRCNFLCYPIDRQRVLDLLPPSGEGQRIEVLDPASGRLKLFGYARFFIRLMQTIHLFKPEVILTTFLVSDLMTRLSLMIFNIIFTSHKISQVIYCAGSPVPVKKLGTWQGKILGKAASWAFSKAELIITISKTMQELLVAEYGVDRDKVAVIPISIPCPEVTNYHKHLKDYFVFGVLCRLTKEKSVEHALDAFARLIGDGAKARLEIFGTGPELNALQGKSHELGIADRTIFHGWTSNPYEALSAIDCLILPSKNEGTPRSILEGGCLGVPSIATRVGGIPDIITNNNTGWLYQYGDVGELTKIMQRLVDNPQSCHETGKKMRQKVLADHSIIRETSRLSELLNGMANERLIRSSSRGT